VRLYDGGIGDGEVILSVPTTMATGEMDIGESMVVYCTVDRPGTTRLPRQHAHRRSPHRSRFQQGRCPPVA
jgi:hypothetical protein